LKKEDAMAKSPKPFAIICRNDSKTFQITLNRTCGLPGYVCAEWRRRSFQNLPEELSQYRNPTTKSAAEAGAVALIAWLKKKQGGGTVQGTGAGGITVGEFARDMFTEGAPHLARWAAKGYILKPQTVAQHRRHLAGYILPRFGKIWFDEITPTKIEDYLLEQMLSNSSRNTILYTLKLVMREAKRDGIIEMLPEFEPFKRNGKRQDVLSGEELAVLFPYDEQELIEIWKRPDDMRKERPEIALMFGTLFCVAVSAGLRSEKQGASSGPDKHSQQRPGDRPGGRRPGQIGPLKKATAEDPRSRAVIIPEITLKMLERWLDRAPVCPDYPGLVFSYRGKPIASYYIMDRFRFGLDRLGIDHEKRRLTVHCLRYTYNTRMKTELPGDVLREFLGHRSVEMTDHYDNPILVERLKAFQDMRSAVERFWDKKTGTNEKPEQRQNEGRKFNIIQFKIPS
jgi:integrase